MIIHCFNIFGIRKNIFTCKNPFENLRIKQTKPKKLSFVKLRAPSFGK